MNHKTPVAVDLNPELSSAAVLEPAETLSPGMRQVQKLIQRIAVTDRPVLILGPTGSGKDVVAQQLHRQSPRASGPFVDVNCCSIPESLIDAELFGHEKGAFTGAVSTRTGHFGQTANGTLFLDEIGDLPLSLQPKLLRAIETRQYRSVGSGELHRFSGRIVAATHRDLAKMVREGSFREDLYYRLSVFTIHVPGLDQRREDIPFLVKFFAAQQTRSLSFTPDALDLLAQSPWPGNVRQLKNVVVRIAVLTDTDCIDAATVEPFLSEPSEDINGGLDDAVERLLQIEGEDKMSAVEHLLVDKVLRDCQGNKTAAARLLGVNRKVIERRVQAHANCLRKAAALNKRAQSLLESSNYRECSAALQTALSHLRALPPSEEERRLRFDLMRHLALCKRAQEGWISPAVIEIYGEALRIGRKLVSANELNTLMFGSWTAHLMRLELTKARELAEEMRLRGLAAADSSLQIDGCIALANTRFWLGEFGGALELVDEMGGLSELQNAAILRQGMNPVALVAMLEGLCAYQRGDEARTNAAYRRLTVLAGDLTHAFSLAIALQGCAWIGCLLGLANDVEHYGRRLLAISQEHGFTFYSGVGQVLVGYVLSLRGQKTEAEEMMKQGYDRQMSREGGMLFHSFYGLLLSRHYLAHGESEKASTHAQQAIRISMEHRELAYYPELLCTRAKALRASGNLGAAEEELRSAISSAAALGSVPAAKEASETLARILDELNCPVQPVVRGVMDRQPTSECV